MTADSEAAIAWLSELFAKTEEANKRARAYYDVLKETKKLTQVLLAEVRCSHGCLLLFVFETPNGPAFHIPRYKLDPAENLRVSSEAGRAKNTEDGDRRWKAQGGMLSSAINLNLTCDHTRKLLELEGLELGPVGKPTRLIVQRN